MHDQQAQTMTLLSLDQLKLEIKVSNSACTNLHIHPFQLGMKSGTLFSLLRIVKQVHGNLTL